MNQDVIIKPGHFYTTNCKLNCFIFTFVDENTLCGLFTGVNKVSTPLKTNFKIIKIQNKNRLWLDTDHYGKFSFELSGIKEITYKEYFDKVREYQRMLDKQLTPLIDTLR